MNSAWRKYLDQRAPRYTSYPSALQFNDMVGAKEFVDGVETVDLYQLISLYVHIPYCKSQCWYCGCNMRVENDDERIKVYVDALIKEIALIGDLLGGRGRLANIHFGGGTPNRLLQKDLMRILEAIELALGLTDSTRLAIEVDPRLVDEGDADAFAQCGFSRVSLGVQDFNPSVQAAINRMQSYDMVERCVADFRRAGVDDIAFDLLFGLPEQTEASFAETIAAAVSLNPDRMSIFGYAHMPHLLARQRLIDEGALPSPQVRNQLAAIADQSLVSAGYRRIGFDHYAKPDNALATAEREGRLRRNFQGFTDDVADAVIGVGASAVSFINGLYTQNAKDIASYLTRVYDGRLATKRGVRRSMRDELFADAIFKLLCKHEADLSGIVLQADQDEAARLERALEQLEGDGVIRRDHHKIKIDEQARPLSRVVAASIDPYAQEGASVAHAV